MAGLVRLDSQGKLKTKREVIPDCVMGPQSTAGTSRTVRRSLVMSSAVVRA